MKFSVVALICMYVIVQTCEGFIYPVPAVASGVYYPAAYYSRKNYPQAASSSSYYYKNQNAYQQRQKYSHSAMATIAARKMIVPVPYGASASYSAAGHSANQASHSNANAYNYQASINARRNDGPVNVDEAGTTPNCDTESPVEVDNSEKYRKEICYYIYPKIVSIIQDQTPEEFTEFGEKFLVPVDNYCDFKSMEVY